MFFSNLFATEYDIPPKTPTHTEIIFPVFVGVFHVKYPRSVCVIFFITPRTEKDVGFEADKNKYVLILTPTPAKPLNMTKSQNSGGAEKQ